MKWIRRIQQAAASQAYRVATNLVSDALKIPRRHTDKPSADMKRIAGKVRKLRRENRKLRRRARRARSD